MPSGTNYPIVPVAASAGIDNRIFFREIDTLKITIHGFSNNIFAAATPSTSSGAGVGFPMPHPGDGSIDFRYFNC